MAKIQSVEPNIADLANGWLKSYKRDYKLEQESLNTEIDQALNDYYSKNGGVGGNRPDAKLLLQDKNLVNYPILIEYKGYKDTLKAVLQTEVQRLAWVRSEGPERFALRGAETQPQRQPRFADLRRACQQVQSLREQIVDHEGDRLVSGALQRVRVNGLQSFDLRHKKPPDKRIRAETSLQSRL